MAAVRLLAVLAVLCTVSYTQTGGTGSYGGGNGVRYVLVNPNGTSCAGTPSRIENYAGTIYTCQSGTMAATAGSPGPAMDINALTEKLSPSASADFIAGYDTAGASNKKFKVQNLPFQPTDAELTCLAGLVSAADKLAYFTGSGACALLDFPAWARTFVAAADASAGRTALGVAIGVDVQAYDADLAAIAALSCSDGQSVGRTAGAWACVSASGSGDMLAANNLSELANKATARTNLGLLVTAGTPSSTECDAAGEDGRIAQDSTNGRFFYCAAGAGWRAVPKLFRENGLPTALKATDCDNAAEIGISVYFDISLNGLTYGCLNVGGSAAWTAIGGGGTFTVASEDEAKAGSDNSDGITSLRLAQGIGALKCSLSANTLSVTAGTVLHQTVAQSIAAATVAMGSFSGSTTLYLYVPPGGTQMRVGHNVSTGQLSLTNADEATSITSTTIPYGSYVVCSATVTSGTVAAPSHYTSVARTNGVTCSGDCTPSSSGGVETLVITSTNEISFVIGAGADLVVGDTVAIPRLITTATAGTLQKLYAKAGTGPVGSALTIDLKINGTTTATVTIAAGATLGSTTTFSTPTLAENDVVSVGVTAVGSGTAGKDVHVIAVVR